MFNLLNHRIKGNNLKVGKSRRNWFMYKIKATLHIRNGETQFKTRPFPFIPTKQSVQRSKTEITEKN